MNFQKGETCNVVEKRQTESMVLHHGGGMFFGEVLLLRWCSLKALAIYVTAEMNSLD